MKKMNKDYLAFGNPSAYSENRLYHLFCEHGKEDLYYKIVYYGFCSDVLNEVPLNPKQRQLLSQIIRHQQKRIANVSQFINSRKATGLWLDMGCGVGQFMNKIVQLRGNCAIGTDISFNSLKKAAFLLELENQNNSYQLINQDPFDLPFKDNVFDYILSADVMEHVGYDNQKNVVSEMYRILKKDGQVIVHTPNLYRVILSTLLKKVYYLFKGIHPRNIKHSFPKSHISLTTSNKLSSLCRFAGFDTKIYHQAVWELDDFHKWAFLGLDRLLPRSFILVLSKV
jgi:ubiquinone/menaquinone biosynthesis C-methylase UbiE